MTSFIGVLLCIVAAICCGSGIVVQNINRNELDTVPEFRGPRIHESTPAAAESSQSATDDFVADHADGVDESVSTPSPNLPTGIEITADAFTPTSHRRRRSLLAATEALERLLLGSFQLESLLPLFGVESNAIQSTNKHDDQIVLDDEELPRRKIPSSAQTRKSLLADYIEEYDKPFDMSLSASFDGGDVSFDPDYRTGDVERVEEFLAEIPGVLYSTDDDDNSAGSPSNQFGRWLMQTFDEGRRHHGRRHRHRHRLGSRRESPRHESAEEMTRVIMTPSGSEDEPDIDEQSSPLIVVRRGNLRKLTRNVDSAGFTNEHRDSTAENELNTNRKLGKDLGEDEIDWSNGYQQRDAYSTIQEAKGGGAHESSSTLDGVIPQNDITAWRMGSEDLVTPELNEKSEKASSPAYGEHRSTLRSHKTPIVVKANIVVVVADGNTKQSGEDTVLTIRTGGLDRNDRGTEIGNLLAGIPGVRELSELLSLNDIDMEAEINVEDAAVVGDMVTEGPELLGNASKLTGGIESVDGELVDSTITDKNVIENIGDEPPLNTTQQGKQRTAETTTMTMSPTKSPPSIVVLGIDDGHHNKRELARRSMTTSPLPAGVETDRMPNGDLVATDEACDNETTGGRPESADRPRRKRDAPGDDDIQFVEKLKGDDRESESTKDRVRETGPTMALEDDDNEPTNIVDKHLEELSHRVRRQISDDDYDEQRQKRHHQQQQRKRVASRDEAKYDDENFYRRDRQMYDYLSDDELQQLDAIAEDDDEWEDDEDVSDQQLEDEIALRRQFEAERRLYRAFHATADRSAELEAMASAADRKARAEQVTISKDFMKQLEDSVYNRLAAVIKAKQGAPAAAAAPVSPPTAAPSASTAASTGASAATPTAAPAG